MPFHLYSSTLYYNQHQSVCGQVKGTISSSSQLHDSTSSSSSLGLALALILTLKGGGLVIQDSMLIKIAVDHCQLLFYTRKHTSHTTFDSMGICDCERDTAWL